MLDSLKSFKADERIVSLKSLNLKSKLLFFSILVILLILSHLFVFQGPSYASTWSVQEFRYWFPDPNAITVYEKHRLKCIDIMRQKYRAIVRKHINMRRPILLDLVDHWNLGDSFIQVGEMTFLEELGYPPRLQCTFHSCPRNSIMSEIRRNHTPAVLLIHGGGNTGDLWRAHARFKNMILTNFSSFPVVALPQTIYYQNPKLATADGRDFRKHRNFSILVRDTTSLLLARNVFKVRSELCPDAAFMIGPIDTQADFRERCKTQYDVLVLSRQDHEAGGAVSQYLPKALKLLKQAGYTYTVLDWFDWKKFIGNREVPEDLFNLSRLRLELGVEMLCQGRIILTNRLHAMILSTLMGKPHVYVDTSFKKIGGFRKTFFSTQEDCKDEYLRAKGALGWIPAMKNVIHFLKTDKFQ